MPSWANSFYQRIRHPAAGSLAGEHETVSGFGHLSGHKYCLLVTYKRDGEPVPTPVWFGTADGKLYARSEADAAKVRRIRNDPRSRVAPCTARGRPLGRPAKGRVRILDQPSESGLAEKALRANYGLGRRLYGGATDVLVTDAVYLKITPAYPDHAGSARMVASQRDRIERLDRPEVLERLEPDVRLLRHRARGNPDRFDGRRKIEIRHDEQWLDGDPPWPTWVVNAVDLADGHHHAEHPSPHARVEHQTVILAHAGAPREAPLSQNTRPALLDPAGGKRAARVADCL